MITLSFTQQQVTKIMQESPTFTAEFMKQFENLLGKVEEFRKEFPDEETLLKQLRYCIGTFHRNDWSRALQYVRDFAVNHQGSLSPETFAELYSVAGSTEFVEKNIGW
jgi:hypothetical protein